MTMGRWARDTAAIAELLEPRGAQRELAVPVVSRTARLHDALRRRPTGADELAIDARPAASGRTSRADLQLSLESWRLMSVGTCEADTRQLPGEARHLKALLAPPRRRNRLD